MSDLLLLIGYPPLIVALVFLAIRNSRKKGDTEAPGPPKEYPYQDRAIPHAGRFLEDSGQSLKDSDMEDLKERLCNGLEREKLYLNPGIRVSDLAERLYTNKSYLAQTIKIIYYILIISANSIIKYFCPTN